MQATPVAALSRGGALFENVAGDFWAAGGTRFEVSLRGLVVVIVPTILLELHQKHLGQILAAD
jgi:hypothetical protein